MSNAWETTTDDVKNILRHHEKSGFLKEAEDVVFENADRIEGAALCYDEMEDQTASAYDEIENVLLEHGILSGPKHFIAP